MYIKSLYPNPPPLPQVNAHYIFFKRPDQAAWPNFTVHIDPVESMAEAKAGPPTISPANPTGRLMYNDYVRNIEDLSTGLAASVEDGGLGLEGWDAEVKPESVSVKGGKEIVGIMSENSSEYITLVHALLRVTVPFALISSYSTPFELKHAFKLSKVTRLFVDEKFLAAVLPVAKEVGLSADRIYIIKEGGVKKATKTRKSFRSIIANVRTRKLPTVDIRPATKDTLAYLVFSSGTSGLPKAVMISHGNLIYSVAQSIVVQQAVSEVYTPPVPQNSEGLPVTLAFLPLHHTYGLHSYCFRACLVPSTLVILPKWDVKVALDAIPRYKISSLTLIPSVVHQLVNHPAIEKADFSTVLSVGSGAAYLPPELGEKMSKLLPAEAQFMEGYGMSEATIAAITQPFNGMLGGKTKRIPGCTGILLPGMEARLFKTDDATPPSDPTAPTDADCGLNEPGELWLRSANIALGYWNNPKANRETFIAGWLRTGDRFRVDAEGNFWFADRAKDTLKVSGAQVSPVEIEDCLLSHPAGIIIDATVAGVSGGRTSDEKVPHAWVVLSAVGKDTSKGWGKEKVLQELDRWHKENLSKYKWLRGGIEVVDEIPKSPTGKVLRRVLQDRYEKQAKKGKGKSKVKAKL
ncbi:acetyl-CoA synthetase-like protein [Agrocybe pediades]|nr:acetyl-CoA synthetase-like protein [Agrocybe pediades]